MTDLYLESIGLINPTVVERDNNGKIERLESRGLDMASLVAFWRRCFDLNDHLFEKITLHCKSKDFNAMGGRAMAQCRSVRELLAEQGVECVVDDEWFKGKEENDYKQKLIATEERYDTLTKTSVEALEKRSKRLDELAEEFTSLEREHDSLKVDFELAQTLYEEKCEEFDKLCSDYTKLQTENEKLKAILAMVEEHFHKPLPFVNEFDIEKKNAVEEFAEKLKRLLHNDYIMPGGNTDERLVFECIDELLKEHEK